MSNILKAFVNIVENYQVNIQNFTQGNNRANNMGDGLEAYIKDVFACTINELNEIKRLEKHLKLLEVKILILGVQ